MSEIEAYDEEVIEVNVSESPDRKRSLDDEDGSENEDSSRGGRYKRQAVNSTDSNSKPIPVDVGNNATDVRQDSSASSINAATDAAASKPCTMRALISTKEAGMVIGKNGKNVADIRERSGAKVTVSENVNGTHERILTIQGALGTVAKAFALVATKYVEELVPAGGAQVPADASAAAQTTQRTTVVRLLVPHARMGAVIGKQGSKLKEFQEASCSKIMAAEEMLPNSTERLVSITGVVDSIHIATYHIGMVLADQPERSAGTIYYRPMPGITTPAIAGALGGAGSSGGMRGGGNSGAGGMGGGHMGGMHHAAAGAMGGMPMGGAGYPSHPGMMGQHLPQHHQAGPHGAGMMAPYGMPQHAGYGAHSHNAAAVAAAAAYGMNSMMPGGAAAGGGRMPSSASSTGPGAAPMGPVQVQQIFIPNDMTGAIIGKGGSKINEVRNASGCQIKIGDPPADGSTERLVTITGTPEQIQTALYMLYQRIESEKARAAAHPR